MTSSKKLAGLTSLVDFSNSEGGESLHPVMRKMA
jgi:hypothetical protein